MTSRLIQICTFEDAATQLAPLESLTKQVASTFVWLFVAHYQQRDNSRHPKRGPSRGVVLLLRDEIFLQKALQFRQARCQRELRLAMLARRVGGRPLVREHER